MAEADDGKHEEEETYWWRRQGQESTIAAPSIEQGMRCPECEAGILQYDSLFVLTCPRCGYVAESGVCT
jgi:uncharacterized C2H2 Zn-finger protein